MSAIGQDQFNVACENLGKINFTKCRRIVFDQNHTPNVIKLTWCQVLCRWIKKLCCCGGNASHERITHVARPILSFFETNQKHLSINHLPIIQKMVQLSLGVDNIENKFKALITALLSDIEKPHEDYNSSLSTMKTKLDEQQEKNHSEDQLIQNLEELKKKLNELKSMSEAFKKQNEADREEANNAIGKLKEDQNLVQKEADERDKNINKIQKLIKDTEQIINNAEKTRDELNKDIKSLLEKEKPNSIFLEAVSEHAKEKEGENNKNQKIINKKKLIIQEACDVIEGHISRIENWNKKFKWEGLSNIEKSEYCSRIEMEALEVEAEIRAVNEDTQIASAALKELAKPAKSLPKVDTVKIILAEGQSIIVKCDLIKKLPRLRFKKQTMIEKELILDLKNDPIVVKAFPYIIKKYFAALGDINTFIFNIKPEEFGKESAALLAIDDHFSFGAETEFTKTILNPINQNRIFPEIFRSKHFGSGHYLIQRACQWTAMHFKEVNEGVFLELPHSYLIELLKQEKMTCNEEALVTSVLKWVAAKVAKDPSVSGLQLLQMKTKDQGESIVDHIHFKELSIEFMQKNLIDAKIVSKEELTVWATAAITKNFSPRNDARSVQIVHSQTPEGKNRIIMGAKFPIKEFNNIIINKNRIVYEELINFNGNNYKLVIGAPYIYAGQLYKRIGLECQDDALPLQVNVLVTISADGSEGDLKTMMVEQISDDEFYYYCCGMFPISRLDEVVEKAKKNVKIEIIITKK